MLLIESERNNKIMASKYFVGIDVGTNETKGILVDEQGREVVSASTTHGVDNPKPNYPLSHLFLHQFQQNILMP